MVSLQNLFRKRLENLLLKRANSRRNQNTRKEKVLLLNQRLTKRVAVNSTVDPITLNLLETTRRILLERLAGAMKLKLSWKMLKALPLLQMRKSKLLAILDQHEIPTMTMLTLLQFILVD